MKNIYDILDEISIKLDSMPVFNKIEECLLEIGNNEELLKKIKKYNNFPDESLRIAIYQYSRIREYKLLENEVNFLILHINGKLKSINSIRSCIK